MANLSFLIIDNFYENPFEVRDYALSLPYTNEHSDDAKKFFRGKQSAPENKYTQFAMNKISYILGRFTSWKVPHGDFRIMGQDSVENGARNWIHFDSMVTRYSSLIYLTLPQHCSGGTAFYRHKELDIDRLPDLNSREMGILLEKSGLTIDLLLKKLIDDGFEIEEKWERLMTATMRFNRCIIFEGAQFHSRTHLFGNTANDVRLTQNFFFDIFDPDNYGSPDYSAVKRIYQTPGANAESGLRNLNPSNVLSQITG